MKFLQEIAEALEDVAEGIGEVFERARERKRQRARVIAEPLGLEVDDHARIHGAFSGVPLRRYSRDHGGKNNTDWWTHTEFTLKAPLPGFMVARNKNLLDSLTEALGTKDIQLGHELDPKLWIRSVKGREDTVRRLLTDPEVLPRLETIVSDGLRMGLEKSTLTLLFRGHHLDAGGRGIREGAALVRAIDDAIAAPWVALGREPHMTLDPAGPCAEGHLRGVPLRVEVKTRDGVTTTRLTGWLDPALPPKTEIVHRARLSSNQELDDPILDKMVAVISSDIEAVKARVCTDAVRGPLLEIVHGHPGSKVLSDRVGLSIRGHVGVDLQRHVDLVVELVQALGGGRRSPTA